MLKLPILYRNYNIEQIKTETQFILLKFDMQLRQVANYLGGASGVGWLYPCFFPSSGEH